MYTRALLLTALAAALAVAPAQADANGTTPAPRATSFVVDRDLGQPDMITYNGHAGLGTSVYQHNQTDPEFLASRGDAVLMADMGGQVLRVP